MSTEEKTKKWYDENAREYTEHVRNSESSLYHAYYEKPAMYAILPDLKEKSVLSLGCGSGEDSHYLKKQGAKKSIGIDLSKELIKIATESYPECEFNEMNMEELIFPDKSIDFAYSSLAIHYLEDWEKVFKEIYRVLKPGSEFLFSCHHPVRFAMESIENSDEKWITKLEVFKDKQKNELIVTGDYLNKRKIADALGENTVDTWNMSIGDITQSAINAGFAISKIVEPRPLEKLKEIKPATYERLNKIPEFIIFKLSKK